VKDAVTLMQPRGEVAEGLDGGSMRARNRGTLLRLAWRASLTSRARLARETGLSPSATSALVEELIASGLVADSGPGKSRGGRRPTVVEFVDTRFAIIGVDLGATHVSVVATDLRGRTLAWRRVPCAAREDPRAALDAVRQLVAAVREDAGLGAKDLLGVGLAVASPVNPQDPGRLPPLFMPAWRDVDLRRDLNLPDDPPLLIDNDANLGALAEAWWGAGRAGADLVFIKLGTGIGAGLVLEGHIFRGSSGMAGEIGHMVIDPGGPPCVCGLQGCLTTFIGTPALLASAERRRAADPSSLLPAGPLQLSQLIEAVQQGDRLARQVISDAAERLGLAVAGLLNLINPHTVVLGGELATLGDALLHPLRARVQERSVWTAVATSRIVASELGERDVALGAATQVLQAALVDPTRFPVQWGV
jgi:predicted NBD/HSP70 family sugar kinase